MKIFPRNIHSSCKAMRKVSQIKRKCIKIKDCTFNKDRNSLLYKEKAIPSTGLIDSHRK